MATKRYDVVVPKKDPRDENKTWWKNVGSLVRFDATTERPEGFILELHMFPDTTFKVFEQKPNPAAPKSQQIQIESTDTYGGEIPF